MLPQFPPAILALADGTVFRGHSIGAPGVRAVGEVVFNTAMTGYQEILTDPSYCRQIVTLTYPHIGNTGINPEDAEAVRVFAAGLVIRDLPIRASNWRSMETLSECLRREGIPGSPGSTRAASPGILREKGAQNGALVAADAHGAAPDAAAAIEAARGFPGLAGMDLARVVSVAEPYDGPKARGTWAGDTTSRRLPARPALQRRRLRFRRQAQHPAAAGRPGLRLTVVPAHTPRRDGAGDEARRHVPVQRPGRPASPATTRSRDARTDRSRPARRSASAWATRSWGWPRARRP